jgi:hypothetical protein
LAGAEDVLLHHFAADAGARNGGEVHAFACGQFARQGRRLDSGCGPGGGLDVGLDDPTAGARAANPRQRQAEFARPASRAGRNLDAAAFDSGGRNQRRGGARGRSSRRRPGRTLGSRERRGRPRLRQNRRRNLFAGVADDGDEGPDGEFHAFRGEDFQQRPTVVTFDLEGGLVGGDFAEDVARRDGVAFFLDPAFDGGLFDGFAEFRQRDFLDHRTHLLHKAEFRNPNDESNPKPE